MRDKLSTELAKEKLKLRSTTVEPVIGNLKANLGFWRFRLSSLKNVRGEFNLMCIAHNLNKLYSLLDELFPLASKLFSAVIMTFKELLAKIKASQRYFKAIPYSNSATAWLAGLPA